MPRRNQIPTREPALFILMGMVLGLILASEFIVPTGLEQSADALSYGLSKQNRGLWLLS